ncbi:MAG: hypothetical protein M4579_007578 [Chaenotheca gracillima]|nr:MAG: hypothetical protein M4579_007578 [Chaenotheca gracillima]
MIFFFYSDPIALLIRLPGSYTKDMAYLLLGAQFNDGFMTGKRQNVKELLIQLR